MNRRDPVLITCAGLVGVASIVASFATLMALAAYVGWEGKTTWLLPACVDALAIGAGRVWLSRGYDAEARRFGRMASMAALVVSVAGNAVGHLLALGDASALRVILAILVGAVPPVALAAVGHLMTLSAIDQPEAALSPTPVPAPAEPAGTSSPARSLRLHRPKRTARASRMLRSARRSDGGTPVPPCVTAAPSTRDRARALWDAAKAKPTGADLARQLGVDASLGRRFAREFKQEKVPA